MNRGKEGFVLFSVKTKERQHTGNASKQLQKCPHRRFRAWNRTGQQVVRYCLVGGVNTLMDVLVLNVLLWWFPTGNVQTLVVYNSLAYLGGAASSFFLNKYWTFGHRQRTTPKEVGRFVSSLLLEMLSSNGLVWLIGNALHPCIVNVLVWGNASKLLAVTGNALLSYLLMRFWVFASRPQKRLKQRVPDQ
jgi:putative flippase GtrA